MGTQATYDTICVLIEQNFQQQSGIMYCITRKECEARAKELKIRNISAEFYHAELSDEKKKNIQCSWMAKKVCWI